ncbi:MAG: SufD family Fe-S cluster assembly protein [Thermotogae bacterium]|nr:SufD family Fe-S cluster assembly protein [Thermotogota bacterium]
MRENPNVLKLQAQELYERLPLPSSKYTNLNWWYSFSYPKYTESEVWIDIPEGVRLTDEGEVGDVVPPGSWKFVAFHYANVHSPVVLRVPTGMKVEKPVRIKLNVRGREHFHLRIETGERSFLKVIVEVEGSGLYTEVVELKVGRQASVTVGMIQNLDGGSVIFAERGAKVLRGGDAKFVGAWFGGKFSMAKHRLIPLGTGAKVEDVQVLFGSNNQHYDLTTHLNFKAPSARGESTLRAVLKDTSRTVLYGMINIHHEAKYADAYLSEHTLLLNSGARADSIPGLEIMTDEVKATHGATVGPIDEEKVFYLRSRGLSERDARELVVLGFFEPALSRIDVPDMRNRVERIVRERMTVVSLGG